MAFIPIPNCVQVNVRGETATGEELLHVFDVVKSGAPPVYSDVLAIATAVKTWVNGAFKTNLVRDTDFVNEIVATSRAEVDGPQASLSVIGNGSRAGTVYLPNEISIAIKKDALRAGRPYRGRFFAWPFFSDDLDPVFPNIITSTFATLLLTTYGSLLTGLTGAGFPMGVASNVLAQINPISGLSLVDLTVDRQGRRGPGRGA